MYRVQRWLYNKFRPQTTDASVNTDLRQFVDKAVQTDKVIISAYDGYVLMPDGGGGGQKEQPEPNTRMEFDPNNFDPSFTLLPSAYYDPPGSFFKLFSSDNGALSSQQLASEIDRIERMSDKDKEAELQRIESEYEKKFETKRAAKEGKLIEFGFQYVRNVDVRRLFKVYRLQFNSPMDDGRYRLLVSMVPDLYGSKIMMGQSPLPNQFFSQYRAFIEKKIQTVIVIGQLAKAGEKMPNTVDCFWPREKTEPVQIEDLPTADTKDVPRYTINLVEKSIDLHGIDHYGLRILSSGESEKGIPATDVEIGLYHIDKFPTDGSLGDMVKFIFANERLRSIAVFCPDGAMYSPAFVNLWIQMQSIGRGKCDLVNPRGVSEHVREFSPDAFCSKATKDPVWIFNQYKLICDTAKDLLSSEGFKGGQVPKDEQQKLPEASLGITRQTSKDPSKNLGK